MVGEVMVGLLVDRLEGMESIDVHGSLVVEDYVGWGNVVIVVYVDIVYLSHVPLLMAVTLVGLCSIHWRSLVRYWPALWRFELKWI